MILTVVGFILNLILEDTTDWNDMKGWIFYNFYFGGTFAYGNTVLVRFLNRMYPWEEKARARVLWGVVISVVFNIMLLIILMMILVTVFEGGTPMDAFSKRYAFTYVIAFVITLVISLVGYSISFYKKLQEQALVNEKLRKEKVKAELNTLKAQVNPHFLFNSFNVLSGLIDEDPQKAQKFLGGLSKIYRYVLEQRNEDLTTLGEELTFAKQYMDLHRMRFEDSVRLDIDIPEIMLERKVPALSLQLLLENAIKHNAFDSMSPLNIKVTGEDDHLKVSNNVRKRMHLNGSNGLGLKNIEERYKLRGKKGFTAQQEGDFFNVILPLV